MVILLLLLIVYNELMDGEACMWDIEGVLGIHMVRVDSKRLNLGSGGGNE